MWNSGLLWAITVAQTVEKLLPKKVHASRIFGNNVADFECDDWYHIQAYQNGSEQGITIWVPTILGENFGTFSICESRKGISGFYFGQHSLISLSHDAYTNRFNAYENSLDCAKEIVRRIKKPLNIE